MTQVIDEAFGFTSEKVRNDDKEGILLYSRAVRTINAAKSGTAGWVHSVAMKFNNPSSPSLAALKFHNHMQSLVDFITSDAAGAAKLDPRDCKLTGSSPLATAFKRIHAAMEAGADLTEQDTSSKCAKFAQEAANRAKEEQRMQAIREELEAQGIDPTSMEGLALIQGKESHPSMPEGEEKEQDEFDKLGEKFAEQLRDLAQFNHSQAIDMANAAISRIESAVTKVAVAQAKSAGLMEQKKAAYC